MKNHTKTIAPVAAIQDFLKLESAGGILLVISALLAMLVANSPLSTAYTELLSTRVAVIVGALSLDKTLLLWINDGLMAIFFLLVGLELKREIVQGQLSNRKQITLPVMAAIGGFVVPACLFAYCNWDNPQALKGWAIPSATDIAFALGVLSLLGKRVPISLKILLTSIAIVDDLAAILVIALFYTSSLSLLSLTLAALGVVALIALNQLGVTRIAAYLLIGIFIWICVLKSGVHATLAGVAVALTIPHRTQHATSPLLSLEHALHPWVAFLILPLFAFVNAGVNLAGINLSQLLNPVSVGIFLGLVIGKQLGVFGFAWLAIRLGLARLPEQATWRSLYAIAVLTGIGFTMSLFITTLAYGTNQAELINASKLGVLIGSLMSALIGYTLLRTSPSTKT